ncbi:MAG TPA: ABC transporter substrate-binding protein [Microbacterium sp.]|nr:ABC transporter substrate-binding protein [Microbacterium sp.]
MTGLGALALSMTMALGVAGPAQAAPPAQVSQAQVQAPKATADPLEIVAPATSTLGAGTFTGTFTPTGFEVVDGALQVVGDLTDASLTVGSVVTPVADQLGTTLNVIGAADTACDILSLDLGPLNLDVLGLVIDLSAINLDITAVPGPGNLLGNLLCAVAGLLDGGNLGQGIANILNRLLGLLG